MAKMIDLDAKDWDSQVQDFRKGKDEFFATSHDSPLAHGKTGSFKGLRYFSPDPRYKILATLHRYDNLEKVTMTTSKGTRQQFHRVGYFEFDIEGKKVKIQAYRSAERESNELFHSLQRRDFRKGKLWCCKIP